MDHGKHNWSACSCHHFGDLREGYKVIVEGWWTGLLSYLSLFDIKVELGPILVGNEIPFVCTDQNKHYGVLANECV